MIAVDTPIACPFCESSEVHLDGLRFEDRILVDWLPCCESAREEADPIGLYGMTWAALLHEAFGYDVLDVYLEDSTLVLVCRLELDPRRNGGPLQREVFAAVDQRGGSWSRSGRPREDKAPTGPKTRWERAL